MSQPRYNQQLQEFIRQWRPNDKELDKRFMDDVRKLLSAVLSPPAGGAFEVGGIITPKGGAVTIRVGDYEAQLDPVQAHHLALSLMESASSVRIESLFFRFMREETQLPDEVSVGMIDMFRKYRIELLQQELAGELAKQTVIPKDGQ